MPGAAQVEEIELIIDDTGGGGGTGKPPRDGGGDDGGDHSGGRDRRRKWPPISPRRYSTGVTLGIISILMFFMALASTFIVVRRSTPTWVPVHLPTVVWINTALLILSSLTLELARRRLAVSDVQGFRKLWSYSTLLGLLFLVGQLVAWRILVAQGVYVASNQASSFFYIFTGAHAAHLLGGLCALLYVSFRNFQKAHVSLPVAASLTSYYWHFMDGLWVFLLALLYLGK
jgi:cytochrome c oxidase subunit III